MSHFSLVWYSQNRVKHRTFWVFHKCVVYEIRRKKYACIYKRNILSLIKRTLAIDFTCCHHTDLPPITKRFKASHTDNILENVFFRMQRGSNYELVEFLGCKPSANSLIWHPSLNLNLFVVWRRSFSRTVSVCDPLNISVVGGKSFAVRWQCAIISQGYIFACKTKSVCRTEQEQVLVAMEFTDQVRLLLNWSCYGFGRWK